MKRHIYFIKILILNGIFYGSVGFLPWLQPHIIQENKLDQIIGFHPYSLYLYLSFFFLIWHSVIKVEEKQAQELSVLIPVSALLAALFYLIFPTTIYGVNQEFTADIVTTFFYKVINGNDTHMNCLPSLHGAITVICIYYLIKQQIKNSYKLLYIIWGLAICWSAIAIRQHLSLDIIAGMLYGIIILYSKNMIIELSKKSRLSIMPDKSNV